jgi:ribosomal RNA-processing protein 9
MTSRKTKSVFLSSRSGGSNKRIRENFDLSGSHDHDDDYIDSSDDDNDNGVQTPSFRDESDVESEEENLDVKKVRLAREYLAAIEEKGENETDASSDEYDDDDEDDDEAISRKLQRRRLEREGALERNYADRVRDTIHKYQLQMQQNSTTINDSTNSSNMSENEASAWIDAGIVRPFHGSGHDLSPTCVALAGSGDDKVVSGSKDHSVLLWDVETQYRIATLSDRWQTTKKEQQSKQSKNNRSRTSGQVLSIACSDDGKFVAVGRRDATVSIFDVRIANGKNDCCIQTFTGHKDAVNGITFRSHTHELFTASADRCIRHYNLDEMLYLETLYGHQFGISGIDCHRAELPISVAADRTARAWKLAEDTHLIFRGGAKMSAADAISVVKDKTFVTGHQDGSVSLWSTDKKRAIASIPHSHGIVGGSNLGRGVVSINCVKGSDLFVTGSNDGYLRFWKICTGASNVASNGTSKKENRDSLVEAIGKIPVHGFINGIAISTKAKFCVAAIGQEHRCGRWERVCRAKNRLTLIPLESTAGDEAAFTSMSPINPTSVDVEGLD